MAISAEAVKQLRERTGAGMMDCKKALEQTNGDMDQAIEFLRKKGALVAAKRADRVANQGIVFARTNADASLGVVVEVNCETDFVARNDDFINFANTVLAIVAKEKPAAMEELLSAVYDEKRKVRDALSDMVGKIGEKIDIRRFDIIEASNSFIEAYTHMGNKIGVLVEITAKNVTPDYRLLGRDIAMQVAAMNPSVITRDRVKKEIVEKELEIYKQQAKNEGKPDQVIERIATGKLEKFYQEVVLLEQGFIKDATKTIKDLLLESDRKFSDSLSIHQFRRYQLGEEN